MDGSMGESKGMQALTRLRISGQLSRAMGELALLPDKDVLGRLRLTSRVRELLLQLGSPAPDPQADQLSDDPNDPNYRYRDTGYIADSRKERALFMFREAREKGTQLRATDVDWDSIERNPRQARELIVKSNLFGKIDWAVLREAGIAAGAAFLIDRVYASVAPEPVEDSPQSRRDYAVGLETLRTRMEACVGVSDVLDAIGEIRDERAGTMLSGDETETFARLRDEFNEVNRQRGVIDAANRALYDDLQSKGTAFNSAKYEVQKRERLGHKVTDTLRQLVADASAARTAADQAWGDALSGTHEERKRLQDEAQKLYQQQRDISAAAIERNAAENPLTRAWATFGPRFDAVLKYRSQRGGSSTFLSHIINAKAGKFDDWGWAEKERTVVERATQQEVAFQLHVVDHYERRGGKPVQAESTQAIKDAFGFRDVQSGNWVLRDPASAKFHVEQTAGAMSDLSDIVGIAPEHLGLGGRLGMAFGARGSGGKHAARAHYEPVQRVINLTKMGGGGCLAHEYFHAVDNLLSELSNEKPSGKASYFSDNPDLLEAPALRAAARELRNALLDGDHRTPQEIKFTDRDVRLAKYNIEAPGNSLARSIKAAGALTPAILAVDNHFSGANNGKSWSQWRRLAAAYYAPPGVLTVTADVGPAVSSFMREAIALDKGENGKYWSQPTELGARAFQSWVEDRLKADDRKNSYLSAGANNDGYREAKPFPVGAERERLNAAFEGLFAAIREANVFENASGNKALLDSVFGASTGEPG